MFLQGAQPVVPARPAAPLEPHARRPAGRGRRGGPSGPPGRRRASGRAGPPPSPDRFMNVIGLARTTCRPRSRRSPAKPRPPRATGRPAIRAIRSIARNPALWSVAPYRRPGFPSPTMSRVGRYSFFFVPFPSSGLFRLFLLSGLRHARAFGRLPPSPPRPPPARPRPSACGPPPRVIRRSFSVGTTPGGEPDVRKVQRIADPEGGDVDLEELGQRRRACTRPRGCA